MLKQRWYEDFKSAQSDGTLPIERRAVQMRYKKTVIWQVDLRQGDVSDSAARGGWTIQFYAPDGTTLLFESKVAIEFFLASLSQSGIFLVTWNIVGGRDEFLTTNVGGVKTDKSNIGQFLLGGTALSEQGDLRPASGVDSTDGVFTITADYYSPIYVFSNGAQALLKGAKVKTIKDTWKLGRTTLAYQWAFLEGGGGQNDATIARAGDLVTATPTIDNRVVFGRAWSPKNYSLREFGATIEGSLPSLQELSDGTILCGIMKDDGYYEFISEGHLNTFRKNRYPDTAIGGLTEARLWPPSIEMPSYIVTDDDARIHIYVDDAGFIFARCVSDSEGLTARVLVGKAPKDGYVSIVQGGDGEPLIVGRGYPLYRGEGFPPVWSKLPVPEGEDEEDA